MADSLPKFREKQTRCTLPSLFRSSRTLHIENLKYYLPDDTTEIVSGGAKGVDADAKEYATQNQIPITEFLPDYQRYGRGAPLKRNIQIIDYADIVLAVWDGKSRGTKFVIDQCKKKNIPLRIIYQTM